MNYRQKVTVVVLDVLIIVQLCVSIIVANQDIENFNPVFFKYFFSMVIPTLIIAKIAVKKFRSKEAELVQYESA